MPCRASSLITSTWLNEAATFSGAILRFPKRSVTSAPAAINSKARVRRGGQTGPSNGGASGRKWSPRPCPLGAAGVWALRCRTSYPDAGPRNGGPSTLPPFGRRCSRQEQVDEVSVYSVVKHGKMQRRLPVGAGVIHVHPVLYEGVPI